MDSVHIGVLILPQVCFWRELAHPALPHREEMEEYCRLCMDIEKLDARLQAEVG